MRRSQPTVPALGKARTHIEVDRCEPLEFARTESRQSFYDWITIGLYEFGHSSGGMHTWFAKPAVRLLSLVLTFGVLWPGVWLLIATGVRKARQFAPRF